MERKENPAARRSRILLINSLIDLMSQKAFEDIRIYEITTSAGLSRQTFYTNFNKKEDILIYALQELFDMLEDRVKEQDMDSFMREYINFWGEHKSFLRVIFKHSLTYLFLRQNTLYFCSREKWVKEIFHIEEKELPYLTEYLNTMTYAMLKTWILKHFDDEAKEVYSISMAILSGDNLKKEGYTIEESEK